MAIGTRRGDEEKKMETAPSGCQTTVARIASAGCCAKKTERHQAAEAFHRQQILHQILFSKAYLKEKPVPETSWAYP